VPITFHSLPQSYDAEYASAVVERHFMGLCAFALPGRLPAADPVCSAWICLPQGESARRLAAV
jgi:hypothetical protein